MKIAELLKTDWSVAAATHKLEARLWKQVQRDGVQVVLFTSPNRGEGKSTTIALLATALGLHPDRRILAVDLDFRDPKLHDHFSERESRGLTAVLRGEEPVNTVDIHSELPSLDLVYPSSGVDDPDLLLKTPRLQELFAYFRDCYDLILVDVPALLPVADASVLLPLADGVVLVAMAGKTTRPELSRAREICLGMDANILGLVIGNLHDIKQTSSYGYDHRLNSNPSITRAPLGPVE